MLHPCSVNLNKHIRELYLHKVLPAICDDGDDGQHGSAVVADVSVLQSLSKRIHYGLFVAESKFREKPEDYTRLIEARDEAGLMALLTNAAVEERVLQRVRNKATTFAQDIEAAGGSTAAEGPQLKVDPDVVYRLYKDFVIPLTKEAEVAYLLQRCGNTRIAYQDSPGNGCYQVALSHYEEAKPAPDDGASAPLRCADASAVVQAVMSNQAFYGLVVLEQGDGGVQPGVPAALRRTPLYVVGEHAHMASFKLMACEPGLSSIRCVCAHSDVLQLCKPWLRQQLNASCRFVAIELGKEMPPWHGRLQGAHTAFVVDSSQPPDPAFQTVVEVGGSARRRTRCLVLCKRQDVFAATGNDKTMALFVLPDAPGRLLTALNTFSKHSVNLTYIHSSSDPASDGGEASFFVELRGHVHDTNVAGAIEELLKHAKFVKVLGSFPLNQHALPAPDARSL